MKARLKKIFIPIFLSIICGAICGRLLFSIYEEKGVNVLESNSIYMLIDSSYDDYNSMKASSLSNYLYYEDSGKYNSVIAITRNKDNIKKIEKIYNKTLEVKEYLLSNKDILSKIKEYDEIISTADDNEEIKKNIIKGLELYKERDDIKMVKIS